MSSERHMGRRYTLLHSRMGRRLLLLFIGSALLPILLLAGLSYKHVAQQLEEQCYKYMHHSAKSMGLFIFMRLVDYESQMVALADYLQRASVELPVDLDSVIVDTIVPKFSGLSLCHLSGDQIQSFGWESAAPPLTAEQQRRVAAGETVIATAGDGPGVGLVYMYRACRVGRQGDLYLVGELARSWLNDPGGDVTSAPLQTMHLFDQNGISLARSTPEEIPGHLVYADEVEGPTVYRFEWTSSAGDYFASYWDIFLAGRFAAGSWRLVLSRPQTDVLSPMHDFKLIFPLVVLLSVLLILLFSHMQIRRTMYPLEVLKAGTGRLAAGDFESQLSIDSGDELEDLANSFNTMSTRLGKQFGLLEGIADIDRAILSTLDTAEIKSIVMTRFDQTLACSHVEISFAGDNEPEPGRIPDTSTVSDGKQSNGNGGAAYPGHLVLEPGGGQPDYCTGILRRDECAYLILPLTLAGNLVGLISLEYGEEISAEEIDYARQLADQVVVALSNSELLTKLRRLNWGTLLALARAVDAKSSWTAGHSERVTDMALQIGRQLELADEDMDLLHRASLLHDIGKLGIKLEILDKPGKLTDEEFSKIREHPEIGARILEPIPSYIDIVPVIMQHHEHFDGRGYPDGLSGDGISLGARIIAVADVYDALHFDRPYRRGWELPKVREFIAERAGTQFDPEVVAAFLQISTGLNSNDLMVPAQPLNPNPQNGEVSI
ncbi:MAG: HD domain-containing protein [bacterium]|nr:HD domain-containing protein [bacterium]